MPIDQYDFTHWLGTQVQKKGLTNEEVDKIVFWIRKYVKEVSAKEERFRPSSRSPTK